jgi:signal transduction histidine kinase
VAGEVDRELLGTRVPVEGSATGDALRSRQAERVPDLRGRLRFALAEGIQAAAGLFIPLQFQGRALGVLLAFDRLDDGPGFSSEDERLMVAFSASAASALGTAQSVAEEHLRRSLDASEQERSRWARELHDETLQELAAVKVGLASARRSRRPEQLDEATGQAIAQIDSAIADLRALITELRPAALDALGAGPALEALIDRVQARSGLAVDARINLAYEEGRARARHETAVESAIYRTTQEALTNVVKHAQAKQARVSVVEDDRTIEISVSDDGVGFDPGVVADGFGLIGMRERLSIVGGDLVIESTPGAGTTLRARIPTHGRPAERGDDAREARYDVIA